MAHEVGVIHIVLSLHYLTHNPLGKATVLSKAQLGSCVQFSLCEDLILHHINEVLQLLDPLAYQLHTLLREKLMEIHTHARSCAAISLLLLQGQSYIYN